MLNRHLRGTQVTVQVGDALGVDHAPFGIRVIVDRRAVLGDVEGPGPVLGVKAREELRQCVGLDGPAHRAGIQVEQLPAPDSEGQL